MSVKVRGGKLSLPRHEREALERKQAEQRQINAAVSTYRQRVLAVAAQLDDDQADAGSGEGWAACRARRAQALVDACDLVVPPWVEEEGSQNETQGSPAGSP